MNFSKNDKITIRMARTENLVKGTISRVSSKFKKLYIDLDNGDKVTVNQNSKLIISETNQTPTKNFEKLVKTGKIVPTPEVPFTKKDLKELEQDRALYRDRQLYFAYGSNMNHSQMKLRCPDAKFMGTAVLPKHKFIIYSRGYATIVPDSKKVVNGLIFSLTKEDEETLDVYEGVKYNTYYKKYMDVIVNGMKIEVLVYIASSSAVGKPKKGYLEKIIEACKKYFSKEYVKEIESWGN